MDVGLGGKDMDLPRRHRTEKKGEMLGHIPFHSFAHVCNIFIASPRCARYCARCWVVVINRTVEEITLFKVNK